MKSSRAAILLMLTAALAASPLVGRAGGVVLPRALIQYPLSIKVDLQFTEKVHWNGIKAGCWAPQENFGMTYDVSMKTHPQGAKSKTANGDVSLLDKSYGSTPFLGAKNGFRQVGTPGGWTLETAYPGGCGTDPAPPVPPGIVAPQCKPVSERVVATVVAVTEGKPGDGILQLRRTPKAITTPFGADIGLGCIRTLHDTGFTSIHAVVDISPKLTYLEIPFPQLRGRLLQLAKAPGSSPSYSYDVSFEGNCNSMQMRPSIGRDPDFNPGPIQPHNAIGQGGRDSPANSTCTLSGEGRVTLKRAGPTKKTDLPKLLK